MSYGKGLHVQTHMNFSAVGVSISFIQQNFLTVNLASHCANSGHGKVDKILLCPKKITFSQGQESSCKESIIIQWERVVLKEYKKFGEAEREKEITLPGKVSWWRELLSLVSMD